MDKMKFIIFCISIFIFSACSKEDSKGNENDKDDLVGTPVLISGEVVLSETNATSVLAISSTDTFKQVDIIDNKFSISLDNGKPWGLMFLDNSNSPIGFLSLGDGIDVIPLHFTKTGINSINFGKISRNGNVFSASYNPIGNEIYLTPEQKISISTMDDYMASLLLNPDVDKNGKIDLLEGKLFKLSVIYFIKPGRFEKNNTTPTLKQNSFIEGYRLNVTIKDKNMPDQISFSGPNGSNLSNTISESFLSFSDHRVYSTPYLYDLEGLSNFIPAEGVYEIKYKNSTITFNLPNQSYVSSNIVYPYPTISLNNNGTMNKIDWSYYYGKDVEVFEINRLLKDLMIQIEGYGNKCSTHQNSNRLYDSERLDPNTMSHIFSCQNIEWGLGNAVPESHNIERVMMTYEDLYLTSYVVMYEKDRN